VHQVLYIQAVSLVRAGTFHICKHCACAASRIDAGHHLTWQRGLHRPHLQGLQHVGRHDEAVNDQAAAGGAANGDRRRRLLVERLQVGQAKAAAAQLAGHERLGLRRVHGRLGCHAASGARTAARRLRAECRWGGLLALRAGRTGDCCVLRIRHGGLRFGPGCAADSVGSQLC